MKEKEAWAKVLGAEVEVAPLPAEITPEIIEKLKELGMELRYIPALDLRIEELQNLNVEEYLEALGSRYPHIKVFESSDKGEKNGHGRWLDQRYWEKIRDGTVASPRNSGYWIALETLKPPGWGKKYEKTRLSERLGFRDRCGLSWDNITGRIKQIGPEIIREVGLDPDRFQIDLPDVFTWNLLANREGWGRFDIGEWSSTKCSGEKIGGG